MRLHRSRRAGVVALLSSVTTAVLAATLVLQPPASAAARPDSGPDLFEAAQMAAADTGTMTFRATGESSGRGTDSFTSPPSSITCAVGADTPRVPVLKPDQIEGSAWAGCTSFMTSILVTVSLFRGDDRVSTKTSKAFVVPNWGTSTFGPCQGGVYFAAGSAIFVPPPGYWPPSLTVDIGASGVVAINGAGTAFPPFICQQSSTPPPTDPPPPSGVPVINSLHCEYLGNNQFDCHLSVSNWTQIRWTYNGTRQAAWDNQTTVRSGCGGGIPRITATASNANGSTTAQDSFRCEGQPL